MHASCSVHIYSAVLILGCSLQRQEDRLVRTGQTRDAGVMGE